jgi:NAD(P)-dependent dehydrogenase (short-subunit alcohol dehydrogenase family)
MFSMIVRAIRPVSSRIRLTILKIRLGRVVGMGLMDGKVAIVTGAGRGIGRGEALELAREGARVVVNELDAEVGKSVVEEIAATGGEAVLDTGDCSEDDTARGLVATAVDTFGRLDALVNNAGILRDRTVAKMSVDEWDAVIKVHLRGHFLPTHHACTYWKDSGQPGRIVCTASTSGLLGNFGQTNYGAAKAGIAAFSTIVAMEMARYGVRCNAIAPAARTRMTEAAYGNAFAGDDSEDTFDFWHPDNVAPLVAYLCSDAAGGISGKVFGIQGDAVELYQPFTSVAVIQNHDTRFTASGIAARVHELFDESGIVPEVENMMGRLRFTMTDRSTL